MTDITIEVRQREKTGKNNNRRCRAQGRVPAVLYGGGGEAIAIDVDDRKVDRILRESGENTLFRLSLEGSEQSRHAMIRDVQYEPRTGGLIHLDFQRILLDEKIRVKVPIEIVGVADGVKNEGGFMDFVTREVEVECLPGQIPPQLEVNVEGFHIGQHVEAGEIELPEGVELMEEADRTIVSIAQPRLVEEDEEVEVDEDLIEAEGEEPEVMSRGKGEEEETE